MAMESMGIGIIGLGTMGRIHAANLIMGIEGARLMAVADPRLEQLTGLGYLGGVTAFTDFHELLEAPGVDAVVVASSSTTHYEVLHEVLKRKLPVLCEKPLAPTVAESVAIHQGFAEAGVPFQIGFMRRFDPSYVRAFRAIADGTIGDVYHYSGVSRDQSAPPMAVAKTSGGFFADTGVHEFDLVRWLMQQEIREVYVRGGVFVSDQYRQLGDVDQTHISLEMSGGALGLIELSRNAIFGYDIRAEILGTRGAIRVGVQAATGTTVLLESGVHGDHVLSYRDRFREAYRAELEAFVHALAEGLPVAVSSFDGIRAVAVADAALQSQQTGKPTEVQYA